MIEVEIVFTHVNIDDDVAVDGFFENLLGTGHKGLYIVGSGGDARFAKMAFTAQIAAPTFREAVGVLIAAVGGTWEDARVVRVANRDGCGPQDEIDAINAVLKEAA